MHAPYSALSFVDLMKDYLLNLEKVRTVFLLLFGIEVIGNSE